MMMTGGERSFWFLDDYNYACFQRLYSMLQVKTVGTTKRQTSELCNNPFLIKLFHLYYFHCVMSIYVARTCSTC